MYQLFTPLCFRFAFTDKEIRLTTLANCTISFAKLFLEIFKNCWSFVNGQEKTVD